MMRPSPAAPADHTRLSPEEKGTLAKQLNDDIAQLKGGAQTDDLAIGQKLLRLRQGNLFRALGIAGVQTWQDYLSKVARLSHTQASKWMLVASHYSAAAVGADGLEVLAQMLQSFERQGKTAPAESELSSLTVTTPGGAKHLAELSSREAEAAFHISANHVAPPADVQTEVDRLNQQLAGVSAQAHVSASITHAGNKLLLAFPFELRNQVAAVLASAPPTPPTPGKKRAANASKKKPAGSKAAPSRKQPTRASRR